MLQLGLYRVQSTPVLLEHQNLNIEVATKKLSPEKLHQSEFTAFAKEKDLNNISKVKQEFENIQHQIRPLNSSLGSAKTGMISTKWFHLLRKLQAKFAELRYQQVCVPLSYSKSNRRQYVSPAHIRSIYT